MSTKTYIKYPVISSLFLKVAQVRDALCMTQGF